MASEEPTGFALGLQPQHKLAISLKICPELRDALVEARRTGRGASLRFVKDSRGQVRYLPSEFC